MATCDKVIATLTAKVTALKASRDTLMDGFAIIDAEVADALDSLGL